MATEVIKKDGTKQAFDPEKIRKSVAGAASQAALSEEEQNKLVEEVTAAAIQLADEKEEIETSEIRGKILGELDRLNISVSAVWRKRELDKQEAEEKEKEEKIEE